jgi:hypothetical protein
MIYELVVWQQLSSVLTSKLGPCTQERRADHSDTLRQQNELYTGRKAERNISYHTVLGNLALTDDALCKAYIKVGSLQLPDRLWTCAQQS